MRQLTWTGGTPNLDREQGEPVFVLKASDPHAVDLLVCLAIMSKDDGPAAVKAARLMERRASKWNREHGGAK